ncbi:hypothetical protein AVEN_143907-1 [Araneus ventricosus]|uniref:Uncharacterized protein n=1 Tax=Araneus ventricosus TaxID=182803 RepID=A0A4Y2ENM0_ARAVE|nr:hypothetical protein AVEN_143907-1 [Araneus ventricosus]
MNVGSITQLVALSGKCSIESLPPSWVAAPRQETSSLRVNNEHSPLVDSRLAWGSRWQSGLRDQKVTRLKVYSTKNSSTTQVRWVLNLSGPSVLQWLWWPDGKVLIRMIPVSIPDQRSGVYVGLVYVKFEVDGQTSSHWCDGIERGLPVQVPSSVV